jgi:N-dimethylarginine dimethylaminohydrolase
MTDAQIPLPFGYHLSLCPAVPDPPFGDPAELAGVWGQNWGATDEVGRLRTVLMRAPGNEYERVRADCWNEGAQALVDPDGMWYWESQTPPDIDLVRAQHQGLIAVLEQEGVEVVLVQGEAPAHLSRPIYTRDPLLTVPGGAVIGRMAPAMRRGEEPMVSRAVASVGMPILRTITGSGLVEGGSFVKLRPDIAAYGTSMRCNDDGAEQLEMLLDDLGIEMITVPLGGWSIHLDGHLGMVSPDAALVDINGLPYWFLDQLRALGIEPIPCPPGEEWAINSLAIRPGVVIMCDGYPGARKLLEQRGVEVITVPYDEVQKGGGGVHCSTMELIRDPA